MAKLVPKSPFWPLITTSGTLVNRTPLRSRVSRSPFARGYMWGLGIGAGATSGTSGSGRPSAAAADSPHPIGPGSTR